MRRLLLLLSLPLLGQTPHFTVREAIQAEWARQPLTWTEAQQAALPPADRARLERTLARIGAPGAPALLASELEKPTPATWLARASNARTPRERFDALFFLNRFKRVEALLALEGLTAADAATWPRHLHLEASIATARLNGAEVSPALQAFLDALQKAGKVDPVRAQAGRLRLVMAGMEKELLPAVKANAGSVLALMDAWNRGRKPEAPGWFGSLGEGLSPDPHLPKAGATRDERLGLKGSQGFGLLILQRLMEGGIPKDDPEAREFAAGWAAGQTPSTVADAPALRLIRVSALNAMAHAKADQIFAPPELQRLLEEKDPVLRAAILGAVRPGHPDAADRLRGQLLMDASPLARAAAIEDLPATSEALDALTKRAWTDTQYEAQQALIQSYARWKMDPEAQKAQLRPWLSHPNWTCRWEAYQALVKLDPATAWPEAPRPTATDEAILKEAGRLAERGKTVRLRITLSGKRSFTLRLDPTVAPINVANLVLLARKGFFDGRRVPRVVPDFVVQMGSPHDTMDGGPGYTVRCENSPDWYGPGSVGMALAGKDTGGSQFFITTNATPHLTGKYTRMGEVEDPDRALKLLDDLELGAKIVSIRVLD